MKGERNVGNAKVKEVDTYQPSLLPCEEELQRKKGYLEHMVDALAEISDEGRSRLR